MQILGTSMRCQMHDMIVESLAFAIGNVFSLRWISDSRRVSISALGESLSLDRGQIK